MKKPVQMHTIKALITALAILGSLASGAGAQPPAGDWDFRAQAEVVRDRSGRANDLRVEGCQWVQSKLGKALRVPANSGRIGCEKPGEALRPAQAMGIIAWVRPLGTGQYCAVVRHGRGWGEEGTAGYRLLVYSDGVRFLLGAGRIINISGGKVTRGQWSQIAASYNGKEAVAFINGQSVVRDLVEEPVVYTGVDNVFEVGSADGGNLDGEIASLKVFNHALTEADVAADWEAGKAIRLTPNEITAERYAKLEKCSLTSLPDGPFARDRHTTPLAHMETNCDADYSRWDGRAGGWRLKRGVPGRFGLGVELPSGKGESGAPILYRGTSNCNMQRGTAEFWMRAPDGVDLLADDKDRYLLTILPEFHLGYGNRPGLHLVMRTHAATRSLQFAASADRISWYSHLNGAWIAESAKTTLHMPLGALGGAGWHHVLCSWSTEGEGRIWLLVDGKGVTTKLPAAPEAGPQIPCYKIFLGGSYFPEVYCPSARALLDEFRITARSVASRLAGYRAPSLPRLKLDERVMMEGEDLCRYFLDFTAKLQMGGGWEGVYTWPNLMPDDRPGSYAAAAEDEYTMRHITPALLRAYEILGEDRYLRAAENCGQMLLKTQDKNGAWCQGYIVMPDKPYPVSPGQGSIEEGTRTDPLRVLFWLWRITGKTEYRDALEKAGQWLIRGQLAGKARGWAEQYGDDGKPAWAREFEPPAACLSSIADAADALLFLYDLTGEDKYLAPLRKCVDWGLNMPAAHKGYLYYDPETGEPITARGYKVFRCSDPGFKSASPYRSSADYFNRLQERIKSRGNGPLIPGRRGPIPRRDSEKRAVSIQSIAAGLEAARTAAEKPLAHLAAFKRGEFPAGNILNEHPRHGRHFWPGRGAPDVQRVLDYIQSAKVLAGEADAAAVPGYADDYFGFIDPARDWFKTPLLRTAP